MTTAVHKSQQSDDVVWIRSAADVSDIVNRGAARAANARVIVLLALGGVFLDAYDLTSLAYGEEAVRDQFHIGSAQLGLVVSAISLGALVGSFFGGALVDRIGRYRVFMADMVFFVVAAIGAALSVNAAMLIGFRFLMGVGVGMDLPVAMAFLAEFSRLKGRGGKSDRTAAWCPAWYAATTACYAVILAIYLFLPAGWHQHTWRYVVGFGAVPALAIIAVRKRYIDESPTWAAGQGDLAGAAAILRRSYGVDARVAPDARQDRQHASAGQRYRELFQPPYRRRTLQNLVANTAQNFGYNSVAFGLPVILAAFLSQGELTTILFALVLNLGFAFTGGMLGIGWSRRFGAWRMTLAGFALQLVAFLVLALLGAPKGTAAIALALAMLGLYLFAQASGPGANLMTFAALSYPTRIRGTGVGFSRGADSAATAVTLFLFPLLAAALSTRVFWVIALAPAIGALALVIGRWEPVAHDADSEDAAASQARSAHPAR
ncbi:major facilitator superfamily MFS_1 [Segniliparus rotundus DSM 44985]|uniref:Major facilitator superfamily MFS_1 n=1 Tax=Segniliparus rotundus (strain ATCC BAA-972 / CDC 1076 / CIP 108378 / DSM 44985 / JCM 13578) TaxID=640132 RepID=D6ZCF9_SEGRD|nr:MFS transporter [Segniliparus rotundus]ADG99128.1 major facilitator superfamily MFS_1 [Segniliparus rotundus DSM 44985]